MGIPFPSKEWMSAGMEAINSNAEYAESAKNWEGDFLLVIEPDEELQMKIEAAENDPELKKLKDSMLADLGFSEDDLQTTYAHLGLFHGKCTALNLLSESEKDNVEVAYKLKGPYASWEALVKGEIGVIAAVMQGKLELEGDMTQIVADADAAVKVMESLQKVETDFLS